MRSKHPSRSASVAALCAAAAAAALLAPCGPVLAGDRVTLAAVAVEGQQTPGTAAGSTFGNFISDPVIGRSGLVGFAGHITPAGGTDPVPYYVSSAWMGAPGALTLVARTNDPAPAPPDGATYY